MAGYLEVQPWINMYSAWVNLLVEQNFPKTADPDKYPFPLYAISPDALPAFILTF
jgi:hypothetical protein